MPLRFPRAIERAYLARLLRRQGAARTLLEEQTDEAGGIGDAVRRGWTSIVTSVRRAFEVAFPLSPEPFVTTARSVDSYTTAAIVADLRRGGVTLEGVALPRADALERIHLAWATENLRLVQRAEGELLDDIARSVVGAARLGDRADLERVLRERWGVGANRARLIARDQTGSLNSQIAQARASALGIERYKWITQRDERVRPEHVKLDRTIRRWDDPHPSEGHPGDAIACRCTALFLPGGVE